jgi:hypothetical protein
MGFAIPLTIGFALGLGAFFTAFFSAASGFAANGFAAGGFAANGFCFGAFFLGTVSEGKSRTSRSGFSIMSGM